MVFTVTKQPERVIIVSVDGSNTKNTLAEGFSNETWTVKTQSEPD